MLAATAALGIGFITLWANPKRPINWGFFSGSIHVALWLMCLEMAVDKEGGQIWVRMASAVGAFLPAHLWILKEVVRRTSARRLTAFLWPWLLAGTLLAMLCFTSWFIPEHSTREAKVYGIGYYVYIAGDLLLYGYLCVQTILQARATEGVSRLELQLLLLGGCAAGAAEIVLMIANVGTHDITYIHLQPLVVIGFYAGTAWAMITTRVFDAKHILFVGLQKLFLIFAVALFVWAANELLMLIIPAAPAFLVAIGLGLWFAAEAGPWFQQVFDLNLKGEDARRAAFEAARKESRPEQLEEAFVSLLKSWARSDDAYVLTNANGQLQGVGMELPINSPVLQALSQLRWATPERLSRQRLEGYELDLQRFMENSKLGVMIASGGQVLNIVVAVGIPGSRRPFTYPQVAQLIELASIIENAMERSRYSVKAQHAEQLATVGLLGASLAHEIRNPLVTIKTFVQLLPQHYGDPVFREKFFHLIGDEVSRIDRLTEQLLDLATPRTYTARELDLHPLLQASLELVAAKAEDREISVIKDFQAKPDRVFTDATAVKQVMLNLCFNAIQAVEGRQGVRWIKLTTINHARTIEIVLEDNGPGISAEMLPRLFQPFQSTKSTGFGLGLAICSDILTGLKATITADPPVAGRGAIFRIHLPCQAS